MSVIIPVFNGASSIEACVQSVLRSRVQPGTLEVICVDNGSTDETLAILNSFGTAIQVLHAAVRGAAAARNVGIRHARGVYLAFTDADCTVHPDWAASLVQPLQRGEADATGGRILARPQAGPVERFGELIHDHQKALAEIPPYLISMNFAARRELLMAVNGFDERWLRMQDVELSYRLVAEGCRLRYCHAAICYHHNRDTLFTLAREGYIHGKFGSAFARAYGHRYEGLRAKAKRSAAASSFTTCSSPASRLAAWQPTLFWAIFRTAKRAGRLWGRLFPPVVIK